MTVLWQDMHSAELLLDYIPEERPKLLLVKIIHRGFKFRLSAPSLNRHLFVLFLKPTDQMYSVISPQYATLGSEYVAITINFH